MLARTDGDMVADSAISVGTAGSGARVCASVNDARLVARAIRVKDTLGSASHVRVAGVTGWTHARRSSVSLETLAILTAGRGRARPRFFFQFIDRRFDCTSRNQYVRYTLGKVTAHRGTRSGLVRYGDLPWTGVAEHRLKPSPVKPDRQVQTGEWFKTRQSASGAHEPGQGSTHFWPTQASLTAQSVLTAHSGRQLGT